MAEASWTRGVEMAEGGWWREMAEASWATTGRDIAALVLVDMWLLKGHDWWREMAEASWATTGLDIAALVLIGDKL